MRGRPPIHGITTDFGRSVWPYLRRLGLDHVPTLARHLGVSPSTVRRLRYETGLPRGAILRGLLDLGVPAAVLLIRPSGTRRSKSHAMASARSARRRRR